MSLFIYNLNEKVNENSKRFVEKNARIMKSLDENDSINGAIMNFIIDKREYMSRKEETDLIPKMTAEKFRVWMRIKHAEISQKGRR